MHNVMTLAERERLAYISGDVQTAQLLAQVEDSEIELYSAQNELEMLREDE